MKKYNYVSLRIKEICEIDSICVKNHIQSNLEDIILKDAIFQALFDMYPDTWKFGLAKLTLEKYPLIADESICIVCQTPEIMFDEFQKLHKKTIKEKYQGQIWTHIDTKTCQTLHFTQEQMRNACRAIKEISDFLEKQFMGIRE